MRLADFIEKNAAEIVDGAVAFAETQTPTAVRLTTTALRNDIPRIMAAIVRDLRTPQTATQQQTKSEGRASPHVSPESAASSHGRTRAKAGFDVNQMVAEYRALRAAVLRMWSADKALTAAGIEDVMRFNEAIDQAITESLVDFTKEVEWWRNTFLAVLGHDLRGPLAAIVGTADMLARKAAHTPFSALVERIALSGMRMSKLLDNLLDYNKAQLGMGLNVELSTCDLEEALRHEIELLRAALPKASIGFYAEGPARGQYDASRIREAVHNLVTNAAKYGDLEKEIQVSLTGNAKSVQLTVCNSGATLSTDLLNSMFEPMRRGSRTASVGEEASLGLGLFIVREIVHAHGGEVTVSSLDGKTIFTAWLPSRAR